MDVDSRVLVVGASCRALAWSVFRVGRQLTSLDLFVDRDLPPGCEAFAIDDFPTSIPRQAALWKPSQIVLAGGMENYPEIVDELGRLTPNFQVTGPQLSALRSVRNWQRWCRGLGSDCDVSFPTLIDDVASMQSYLGNAAWLWKPHAGAGGLKIRSMDQMAMDDIASGYLQPRLDGVTLSVSFLSNGHGVKILGVMQSLCAHETGPYLNPRFAPKSSWTYTGSYGPIETSQAHRTAFMALGQRIVAETQYQGLLQMDILIDQHQKLFLIDINPRWTASMELVEMATNRNLIDLLLNPTTESLQECQSSQRFFKWILYATEEIEVSQTFSNELLQKAWTRSPPLFEEPLPWGWADIPQPMTRIRTGEPFATLIGRQPTLRSCTSFFNAQDWEWLVAFCRETL
jgi:uncharacterized protein